MAVRLNGEQSNEVDCFKYPRLQISADEGCEGDVERRINKGYKAWRVLINR